MDNPGPDTHERFMRLAMALGDRAAARGEVPVGCVVVRGGQVVGRGHNLRESTPDPTAHAEIVALRDAASTLGTWRLDDCTLYVTLEPCPMCAGALVLSRIRACVYGCADPKAGFLGSLHDLSADRRLNHRFEVRSGVLADACAEQLRAFFRKLRRRDGRVV